MQKETIIPIDSAFIEALNSQQSLRIQIQHLRTAIDNYQYHQCPRYSLQRHVSHNYLPSSTFPNRERRRRQQIMVDLYSPELYISYIDGLYYSHSRPYSKFRNPSINFGTDLNLTQRQLQIQNHLLNLQYLRDDHYDRKNNQIDTKIGFNDVFSRKSTDRSINNYSRNRKLQYCNSSSSNSKSEQNSTSNIKQSSSQASSSILLTYKNKHSHSRSATKSQINSTDKSKPKESKSQGISKWMYIRDVEQLQKKIQQKRKRNLNQSADRSVRVIMEHKLSQGQKGRYGNLNKSIECQPYNPPRPQILPKSHQDLILENIKNRVKASACTFNKLSHATSLKNSQHLHKRYIAEESKRKACRQQLFAFVNRRNKKYATPFFVKQGN